MCPNLCDPMDCSLPGFSVHVIFQQEYWSGLPFPSPGDLPDQGTEPGSPTFQADTLTSEPPGKPTQKITRFCKVWNILYLWISTSTSTTHTICFSGWNHLQLPGLFSCHVWILSQVFLLSTVLTLITCLCLPHYPQLKGHLPLCPQVFPTIPLFLQTELSVFPLCLQSPHTFHHLA